MKKRCFPRYDAHIDARYCADDAARNWRSCLITKISRKGIGVVFPAGTPPAPGAALHFELSTAQESGYVNLQGVLKWIKRITNGYAGGIELDEIVDEAAWLQMIYFIREASAGKQVVDLKSMIGGTMVTKTLHPPPAKVIIPTKLDYIKNILNYKIL